MKTDKTRVSSSGPLVDFKFDDLQAFVAAVRHQSVSQAAEALGLTQPAVTRRIQNLEEALALVLLDRTTKPPRPTEIGTQAYSQGLRIIAEVEALLSLSTQDRRHGGVLRIGVTQGLAEWLLSRLLDMLHANFPDIQPRFTTHWSRELLRLQEIGELDTVLATLPLQHHFPDSVQADLLQVLPVVVVAARGRWSGQVRTFQEIQGAGWVLNPHGCGFRKQLQTVLEENGLSLNILVEAAGTELQLQTIANGLGLGVVPEAFLASSPQAARLDVIEVEGFSLQTGLWHLRPAQPLRANGCLDDIAQTVRKCVG